MTHDTRTSPDAQDKMTSASQDSSTAHRTSDAALSGQESSGQESSGQESPGERERRGPPPNPLYHPLFLPVLLVGFTLWFFWDGFLTSDPEMQKHQLFNRVFFGITLLFCLRIVPRGIREYREDREAAKAAEDEQ